MNSFKTLFIGDINGKIGRQAVALILPDLIKVLAPDLVVANAENAAHGSGLTVDIADELLGLGIDCLTTGDHAFNREKSLIEITASGRPVLRPANFPPIVPGIGHILLKKADFTTLVINLIGRTFMRASYDCPFRKIDEILAMPNLASANVSAIIVDIHAEATSEKIALLHYLDGKVSAVLGTHTHVVTADELVTDKGTAFITDIGMAGYADGILGLEPEPIVKNFLTQIRQPHEIPETGRAIVNAVLLEIDAETKRATGIERIVKDVKIE